MLTKIIMVMLIQSTFASFIDPNEPPDDPVHLDYFIPKECMDKYHKAFSIFKD